MEMEDSNTTNNTNREKNKTYTDITTEEVQVTKIFKSNIKYANIKREQQIHLNINFNITMEKWS
eukprot:1590193-Ditylum_brightwellii.AAC.1